MNAFLLLALTSFISSAAVSDQPLRLVSSQAGRVADHITTTREVLANGLLENALGGKNNVAKLNIDKPTSREFIRETTAVLLEWAIINEVENSATANLTATEISAAEKKAESILKKNPQWTKLKIDNKEFDAMLTRKLRAKKFIQFKIETSSVPVSDREAKDYFDSNRLKFEDKPFESFKDVIKKFLGQQQVDRRLKDWFELLQVKYKVRNFLAEG